MPRIELAVFHPVGITSFTMSYVDLHCHVLPGLDDGCQSIEESLRLLDGLIDLGFSKVAGTTHQRQGLFMPDLDEIRSAAEELNRAARETGLDVEVIPAAENCYDGVFWERSKQGWIPCYGETKSFLVELVGPPVPPDFEQRMFEWRMAGMLPVLAHIERYGNDQALLDVYRRIGQNAALAVNLDSVAGQWGRGIARWAKTLLDAGLVSVLTTDSHGTAGLGATQAGMKWVDKHLGRHILDRLCGDNPKAVLAGRLPELEE